MSTATADLQVGMLADNVVHFARALRHAGMPIGPAKVIDALRALQVVGVERRDDFYYALAAVLVDRRDQQMIFDQAFDLFWRDPSGLRQAQQLQSLLSGVRAPSAAQAPIAPRVAQALWPNAARAPANDLAPDIRLDASMTMSPREVLQARDFAAMTPDEMTETKRLIASLHMPFPGIASRRTRPVLGSSRVDLRSTLRHIARSVDGFVELRHCALRVRPATIVILCDISGSMESYTRMLLHFIHAISNRNSRVHTFLFGTRLSNITRSLRDHDVDIALDRVAQQVNDWAGGTRIRSCLADFNLHWARRLLGQGAVVLLITDGLESDDADGLGTEMQRLNLACRQLVWLNPLLRFVDFEARPSGIRAMLPHVDLFLPTHNLTSLARLGAVLNAASFRRQPSATRASHFSKERYGNV